MPKSLSYLRWVVPLMLALPAFVHAANGDAATGTSFTQAIGLFNVFVGLMLTAALLTYGIGFVIWSTRLGTWPTYRTEAIKIMEWSVVTLFVLVVLLAVVQFFQYHPREAAFVVSVIVAIIVVWIIVYLAAHSGGKKKDDHA
ncbi:hypothetical protein A3C18_04165 [Candidatus Kaiserbacteria bacterium RIFCSPHIGHO2_02_FULL_54_11b]|uniref:Uncharacterized protein n=2 Tax=Candidatus Kaiseribacteriota TaxID=1752734 RepID=A0A1F6CS35_9BACT|nr:MAG: hypothetical protein A2704_00660 [Candidatus Kaiserbacteria bacterium RIFCSPHIGHO2_01_FULL_54_36b]OGG64904.1 MAG: hypothetical protein A3C18_04165 [Candidatus Kaiserbacteria bacterium RIFCSPHIGHO2_02_FULL_54_11b]